MCYHHQPQQIINENTIPSHGSVFKPRPFNVLCFYYAKLALVYILFVRAHATRSFYVHFAKNDKIERKRHTVLEKPSLGDLSTGNSSR